MFKKGGMGLLKKRGREGFVEEGREGWLLKKGGREGFFEGTMDSGKTKDQEL